jgi:hypothetical protein
MVATSTFVVTLPALFHDRLYRSLIQKRRFSEYELRNGTSYSCRAESSRRCIILRAGTVLENLGDGRRDLVVDLQRRHKRSDQIRRVEFHCRRSSTRDADHCQEL